MKHKKKKEKHEEFERDKYFFMALKMSNVLFFLGIQFPNSACGSAWTISKYVNVTKHKEQVNTF